MPTMVVERKIDSFIFAKHPTPEEKQDLANDHSLACIFSGISLERVYPTVERNFGLVVAPPDSRYQAPVHYGSEYITGAG
eukprot:11153786-Karenia_brevis.AAC.1